MLLQFQLLWLEDQKISVVQRTEGAAQGQNLTSVANLKAGLCTVSTQNTFLDRIPAILLPSNPKSRRQIPWKNGPMVQCLPGYKETAEFWATGASIINGPMPFSSRRQL